MYTAETLEEAMSGPLKTIYKTVQLYISWKSLVNTLLCEVFHKLFSVSSIT